MAAPVAGNASYNVLGDEVFTAGTQSTGGTYQPPGNQTPDGNLILTMHDVSTHASSTQSNVVRTRGQLFRQGDIPSGKYPVVKIGSTAISTQCNAKSYWSDGSLKHCSLGYILSGLNALESKTLTIDTTSDALSGTAVSKTDVLATAYDCSVDVDISATVWSASARDALTAASTPATWRSGPVCSEFIVTAPLNDGANDHPHLTARFHILAWSVSGTVTKVRTHVIVENTRCYVDRDAATNTFATFTGDVSVTVEGAGEVLAESAVAHPRQARWCREFWWGGQPSVSPKHDIAYLKNTRAIPNYETGLTTSESDIATQHSVALAADGLNEFGLIYTNFPDTGGRPDLGPLPRWCARYLATTSQDYRCFDDMIMASFQAGMFSVHWRDEDTDLPMSIDDYPYCTITGNYADTYNSGTGLYEAFPDSADIGANQLGSPDIAHQPQFSFLPYLLTCDLFHYEEMSFWGGYNFIWQNPGAATTYRGREKGWVLNLQVRAAAWSLRTMALAQFIAPDTDALTGGATNKAYWATKLANNYDEFVVKIDTQPYQSPLGYYNVGYGHFEESGSTKTGPFMEDFLVYIVEWMTRLGFTSWERARRKLTYFNNGRMGSSYYCQTEAALYHPIVRVVDGAGAWATNFKMLADFNSINPAACPGTWNGNPADPESFLAIYRASLAASVAEGRNNASTHFSTVKTALSNAGAPMNTSPQFAIEPFDTGATPTIDTITPGTWIQRGLNTFASQSPEGSVAWFSDIVDNSGQTAVINAWNGGIFDWKRNRMILWGGGHQDYGGNEVYAHDIVTGLFTRLTDPSDPNGMISTDTDSYPDGNPIPRHTYNTMFYVPTLDKYFVGGVWCSDTLGVRGDSGLASEKSLWAFDPNTNTWELWLNDANMPLPSVALYDPVNEYIWVADDNDFASIRISDKQVTKFSFFWSRDSIYTSWALDPVNQLIVSYGAYSGTQTRIIDISNPAVPTITVNPTWSGDTAIFSEAYGTAEYHPPTGKIVLYREQADIYLVDAVARTIQRIQPGGSNAVIPPAKATGNGSLGRMRWIPDYDAFMCVYNAAQAPYYYKLNLNSVI